MVVDGRDFFCYFRQRSLATAAAKVPEHYFAIEVAELLKIAKLSSTDRLIKSKFWAHVHGYPLKGRKAKLSYLYSGVCSYTHFYNNIISNPAKLAWILRNDESDSIDVDFKQQLMTLNETAKTVPLTDARGNIIGKNLSFLMRYLDICIRLKKY